MRDFKSLLGVKRHCCNSTFGIILLLLYFSWVLDNFLDSYCEEIRKPKYDRCYLVQRPTIVYFYCINQ